MEIQLSVFGEEIVRRELLRWADAAEDMDPVFAELRDDFYDIEERAFATEGKWQGEPWEQLSPRYARWKARHFPGTTILEREGKLKQSLTSRTGPDAIYDESEDGMFVGSRNPYGAFHQHGTRNMPRRPPVAFTEADKQRWVKQIQLFMATGETGGIGL